MLLKKCGELVEMHYFCKTKRKNHLLRKKYAEKFADYKIKLYLCVKNTQHNNTTQHFNYEKK